MTTEGRSPEGSIPSAVEGAPVPATPATPVAPERPVAPEATPEVDELELKGLGVETVPEKPKFFDFRRLNIFRRPGYVSFVEGAKKFENWLNEKLYRIPVFNRVLGKFDVMYNNFWSELHANKKGKINERIKGVDIKIEALNKEREAIERLKEKLSARGLSTVSLDSKLRKNDAKREVLEDKKERISAKIPEVDAKREVYESRKLEISRKIVGYFEDKTSERRGHDELLKTNMERLNASIVEFRAGLEREKIKIQELKNERLSIEADLRSAGFSDRKIKGLPIIMEVDNEIESAERKIREQTEQYQRAKKELQIKIDRSGAKLNKIAVKYKTYSRIIEKGSVPLSELAEGPAASSRSVPPPIPPDPRPPVSAEEFPIPPAPGSAPEAASPAPESVDFTKRVNFIEFVTVLFDALDADPSIKSKVNKEDFISFVVKKLKLNIDTLSAEKIALGNIFKSLEDYFAESKDEDVKQYYANNKDLLLNNFTRNFLKNKKL